MSLVGPRPTVQVQVEQYTPAPARPARRSSPGITGWAQVKGRAALPWHERIELDLWYVEHWSLRLDLRILAATVRLLRAARASTAAAPAAGANAPGPLAVVPEHVGSSGPPWRLGAAKHPSPKEDTGWIFTLTPPSA